MVKTRTYLVLFFAISSLLNRERGSTRRVTLTYTCHVFGVPKDTKTLDCWIPVPSSDDRQSIEIVKEDESNGRITTEGKYGNRMYYQHIDLTKKQISDTATISISYNAVLSEKSVPEAKTLAALPKTNPGEDMKVYLSSNSLIPLQGPVTELNRQLNLSSAPIPAARQIYDYLIGNMVYNYKAPGAGRGDVLWACNSHTGDCSDYHSIFIGVCRSAGIPADHVFGLPLRVRQGKAEVSDWHCWARFWVSGPGWITIDASEAAKHPELRDYNFGTLSNIFLSLSHGRDVILEPAQKGQPLNIFASPYVEADGKNFQNVQWSAVYQEEN